MRKTSLSVTRLQRNPNVRTVRRRLRLHGTCLGTAVDGRDVADGSATEVVLTGGVQPPVRTYATYSTW